MPDRDPRDAVAADQEPPSDGSASGGPTPSTVGTGSAIAIGCVVALIVVVVVALVLRWLTGIW